MYRFKAISVPGNTNEGYGMSHIPVPIAKLTSVESTDLEEAITEGIQYQYDQEASPIKLAHIKWEVNINYQYPSRDN